MNIIHIRHVILNFNDLLLIIIKYFKLEGSICRRHQNRIVCSRMKLFPCTFFYINHISSYFYFSKLNHEDELISFYFHKMLYLHNSYIQQLGIVHIYIHLFLQFFVGIIYNYHLKFDYNLKDVHEQIQVVFVVDILLVDNLFVDILVVGILVMDIVEHN